jgi:hypothetical protein
LLLDAAGEPFGCRLHSEEKPNSRRGRNQARWRSMFLAAQKSNFIRAS